MEFNSYKEDEKQRKMKTSVVLTRLFSYMLKFKWQICFVLFIMLICVGITTVNPLFVESAIDKYIAQKNLKGLLVLGGIVLGLNVLMVLLVKLRMFIMAKVSNHVILDIRQQLFDHIQTLDFQFFDSRPTGKILARIIGDVNSLKEILENSVTTLIPELLTLVAVVVIMFTKNAILASAALCTLPVLVVLLFLIEKFGNILWESFRKKSSNINAFLHEDISGIRVVQAFDGEKETNEEFSKLAKDYKDTYTKAVYLTDSFFSATVFCRTIGAVLMYYVGIKVIGVEDVSIGTLIAFGTYMGMFWQPIQNLSNFYNQLVTNIAAAERVFEILDTDPCVKNACDAKNLPEVKGDVKFENVTFSYGNGIKILENMSFCVNAGETIALVGPTGAGKTTVVNLLSRFYDIQEGAIKIDGHNIQEVTLKSLRKQMGVMTQENYLFTGTIMENIRYGNLGATDEEVYRAAEMVHADDFISKLPEGYNTKLSERGGGLSNGQKQLVAFARTMLSKPKILILDEATSSIDTHTEILVQQGIENLLKGRTSFVIAHRLSTIKNADRIFVIDDGGIVEQGTPAELMDSKGFYYELYMSQFKNIA